MGLPPVVDPEGWIKREKGLFRDAYGVPSAWPASWRSGIEKSQKGQL